MGQNPLSQQYRNPLQMQLQHIAQQQWPAQLLAQQQVQPHPQGLTQQHPQEIVQQPRGRKGLKNLANVLVENDGGRIGRRAVTLDAWRKMMSVLRPDLISNPWIYDLMFVASSNSIKTSEQFKEDPTINYKVRRLGSLLLLGSPCCWRVPF